MQEYGVNYAKLFSISGVIYVRRSEKNPNELIFSKTYTSLDGEVTRSLCMILEARERATVESARAQTIPGRLDLFSRLVRAFVFGWITKWVRQGIAMHNCTLHFPKFRNSLHPYSGGTAWVAAQFMFYSIIARYSSKISVARSA